MDNNEKGNFVAIPVFCNFLRWFCSVANELTAGRYYYSLIADAKLIDIKRMELTD